MDTAASDTAPDSPEALQTIPHVRLSDIPREPAELPLAIERDGALLLHELPTDGIAYPVFYFAADDLSEEELPYASLLCAILSQLPTKHMEALELQKQLRLLLGSFAVSLMPCTKYQSSQEYRLFAAVSCSALETKLPEAMRLFRSMGFYEIPASRETSMPQSIFMQLLL